MRANLPGGFWCGITSRRRARWRILHRGQPRAQRLSGGYLRPCRSRRSDCVDCPPGSSCAGSAQPELPARHESAQRRSPECEPCPQGTYRDELGSSQCKSCPPGRFCPVGSVNAASVCGPCSNATSPQRIWSRAHGGLGRRQNASTPRLKVGDIHHAVAAEKQVLGGGYCVDGHEGPLCEVCSKLVDFPGARQVQGCPDYSLLTATSFLAASGRRRPPCGRHRCHEGAVCEAPLSRVYARSNPLHSSG